MRKSGTEPQNYTCGNLGWYPKKCTRENLGWYPKNVHAKIWVLIQWNIYEKNWCDYFVPDCKQVIEIWLPNIGLVSQKIHKWKPGVISQKCISENLGFYFKKYKRGNFGSVPYRKFGLVPYKIYLWKSRETGPKVQRLALRFTWRGQNKCGQFGSRIIDGARAVGFSGDTPVHRRTRPSRLSWRHKHKEKIQVCTQKFEIQKSGSILKNVELTNLS